MQLVDFGTLGSWDENKWMAADGSRGSGCSGVKAFPGIILTNASLDYADLTCFTFDGVSFQGATFRGADLRGAVVRGLEATNHPASFALADLRGATFQGVEGGLAHLRDVDFRGADLSYADFGEADVSGAEFACAKLVGARFNPSFVMRATFKDAVWQEPPNTGESSPEPPRMRGRDAVQAASEKPITDPADFRFELDAAALPDDFEAACPAS
jgi:hypothetical protein